jgi:hypothetical protein
VLAFGLGLVFGYSFDTTGPIVPRGREEAPAEPTVTDRTAPGPPSEPAERDAPPAERVHSGQG